MCNPREVHRARRPRGPLCSGRRRINRRPYRPTRPVGVGMTVTHHPLHRSVRAELPHTAPALGRDDQTLVRVRVADARGGNQCAMIGACASSSGAWPGCGGTACDATSGRPGAEDLQPRPVAGHAEVADARPPPRAGTGPARRWGRCMRLRNSSLTACSLARIRLALVSRKTMNLPLPGLAAAVREAQEVEGLGFALSPAASVLAREAPELDQPRLVRRAASARTPSRCVHLAPGSARRPSRCWNPATQSSA